MARTMILLMITLVQVPLALAGAVGLNAVGPLTTLLLLHWQVSTHFTGG